MLRLLRHAGAGRLRRCAGRHIAGTGTTRHFGTASDASHLDAVTTAIHIDAAAPNGHIGAVTPNHPVGAAAPNGLIGAATPNHPGSTATTNVTPERAAPLAQSERTTQEGTPDATLGVPSDECDVSPELPPGVMLVDSVPQAEEVVRRLRDVPPGVAHAVDVEVFGANVREDSPWAKGEPLCFSVYCGPQYDFGTGPKLFVDCRKPGVMAAFAPYFADPQRLKVFHNYSYDRGFLCRALRPGDDVPGNTVLQGFHADTMHMARLLPNGGVGPQRYKRFNLAELSQKYLGADHAKVPFREKFMEFPIRSDGTPSKRAVVPSTERISETKWYDWVEYATHDTVTTWQLFAELQAKLLATCWEVSYEDPSEAASRPTPTANIFGKPLLVGSPATNVRKNTLTTMWHFYEQWYRPFGQMLSEVEELGIRVDTKLLEAKLAQSEEDVAETEKVFREWVFQRYVDKHGEKVAKESRIKCVNLSSDAQKRQLLFAPFTVKNKDEDAMGVPLALPESAVFASPVRDPEEDQSFMKEVEKEMDRIQCEIAALQEAMAQAAQRPAPKGKKKAAAEAEKRRQEKELRERQVKEKERELRALQRQHAVVANPKRPREVTVHGLGLPRPSVTTARGFPSTGTEALLELSGDPSSRAVRGGKLRRYLLEPEEADKACRAIYSLTQVSAIKKAQESFLRPLLRRGLEGRIHPDLNLNTDTGRLSCRRPNFQNLPAGPRDEYGVRKSIIGEPGRCIITADYSQLELRVLAHVANCQTLIDAFKSGADIHSETAYDLHPHIAEAYGHDRAKAMVDLKKRFAAERNKAKTLNFGILYGQSAVSLAKDWGTTKEEAERLRERWFAARPEVRVWQEGLLRTARKTGLVHTIMGRPREILNLGETNNLKSRGHAERTVINTPIQGSAADIVMVAMLNLRSDPLLRKFGYRVIMQVHDEVLMEGPAEAVEEAMSVMQFVMAEPEGLPHFKVPLEAEAKLWTEK